MVDPKAFASVIALLESATGAPPTPADRVAVYYDLLADLPLSLLQAAAKRAALVHRFPSLPPAGSIRSEARKLEASDPSPTAAWELAVAAVRKYGIRRPVTGLKSLPPAVERAARAVGWEVLCDARREDTLVRHQFLTTYDAQARSDQREAELPAPLRVLSEGIGSPLETARQPPVLPPRACADDVPRADLPCRDSDAP